MSPSFPVLCHSDALLIHIQLGHGLRNRSKSLGLEFVIQRRISWEGSLSNKQITLFLNCCLVVNLLNSLFLCCFPPLSSPLLFLSVLILPLPFSSSIVSLLHSLPLSTSTFFLSHLIYTSLPFSLFLSFSPLSFSFLPFTLSLPLSSPSRYPSSSSPFSFLPLPLLSLVGVGSSSVPSLSEPRVKCLVTPVLALLIKPSIVKDNPQ